MIDGSKKRYPLFDNVSGKRYPTLSVVSTMSPPFRRLTRKRQLPAYQRDYARHNMAELNMGGLNMGGLKRVAHDPRSHGRHSQAEV
jgi:hypothetical protein